MDTSKVTITEQLRMSVTNRVENIGEGLKVIADITETNGKISAIDNIRVLATTGETLFEGWASTSIGGNFQMAGNGREVEVMTLLSDFLNAVRENSNE